MRTNLRTSRRHRLAASIAAESLERRVLLSSAIAAFGNPHVLPVGSGPTSVATADLNNDGKLDLVVANAAGNSVGVLLGNGNGTFQPQRVLAAGLAPFSVAVADVNNDGKP